jgi:tetratricopeptide (TPR) repeat protein
MKHALKIIFIAGFICSCPANPLLSEALKEYGFQNFNRAAQLFSVVIKDKNSTPDEKIQARLGAIMVIHYQMPGGNPQKALVLYKQLAAKIPADHFLLPNIYLFIGRAFFNRETPQADSATVWFDKIITRYPGTICAHEAVLEKAYIALGAHDLKKAAEAVGILEKYLSAYPTNPFAGTMHGVASSIAMTILNDYALARTHLIAAYDVGVVNVFSRGTILFQIAQISEKKLHDPTVAVNYYQKLIAEEPNDFRVYYSRLRIKALSKEKQ